MIKRLTFVNIFPATTTFICVIGWWRVKLFPNFASLPFYYRPNNITGDKLPSQSWVVLVYRINNSTHSELGHNVIWLSVNKFQNFSTKYLLEFFLMYSFVCLFYIYVGDSKRKKRKLIYILSFLWIYFRVENMFQFDSIFSFNSS